MSFIDPHIHMVSRTTDDYQRLALAGCAAVAEPAFWAGVDRGSAASFGDYFRQLTEVEPRRASQYGIRHCCWLGMNAKEAENVSLSREVIGLIPEFLDRPGVLGIGEIGLNKNTPNECLIFREQLALAGRRDELALVHTPHLADKYRGTRMILNMVRDESRLPPERVLIDHAEEHTIRPILDAGHWCGLTLYPLTKCTPRRAVDMIETYGSDRITVSSSADWGPSNPMAVAEFMLEMRMRGADEAAISKIVYDNPVKFFSQCCRFESLTTT